NRLRFTLDPTGALSETRYNAAGQVESVIQYATFQSGAVTTAAGAGSTTDMSIGTIVTGERDRVTSCVYDRDGRKVYELDAIGSLVRVIRYSTPRIVAGLPDKATVAALLPPKTAAAVGERASSREQFYAYDAANRPVYEGTKWNDAQQFAVTATAYDGAGRT